jgi:poly-gamma-glutamate capsule biosynthesis protein CapA/YwtB (metallophosphatase superfamily)
MLRSSKTTFILCLHITCIILSASFQQSHASSQQQADPHSEKNEIVIAAVGDIMMPTSIQKAVARNKYNYALLFEKIVPDLSSADITVANLETPVDHTVPVSGYPKFNTRPEFLAALKKAGLGIVSLANNHALDAGPEGLKRTLDNIQSSGLLVFGAGRTPAEAEQAIMKSVRGVAVAFLGYTYSTNERMPKKKENFSRVNILRAESANDLAQAASAVRKVRPVSDLVIVSLHWGDEYKTVPTSWQRRVAAALIESGADIILGHHPHVLQPIVSYTAKNGRQGLIAFSLGNFISSQNYGIEYKNRTHAKALRGDGIILKIFVSKGKDKTSIVRAEFLPIWTLRDRVGKNAVNRPITITREIARLEAIQKRTKEEDNNLKLLMFRNTVIMERLTEKQVLSAH